MYLDLALLAGCVWVVQRFAGRLDRSWILSPIIFMGFGLVLGPFGLGWLSFEAHPETFKLLAELTLAWVLFTDAVGIDLRALRQEPSVPARLLWIGLPLTLLLGFGAGVALLDELSWLEIALLATLLAPTDAMVGRSVVANPSVPRVLRQSLQVESGLSAGICVPILVVCLTLSPGDFGSGGSQGTATTLLTEVLGMSLLVGVVLVLGAFAIFRYAPEGGQLGAHWARAFTLVLAPACFAMARHLGGSGLIAAFCGGLLLGHLLRSRRRGLRFAPLGEDDLWHAAKGVGELLSMIVWIGFGSAVVGIMSPLTWPMIVYGLVCLALVRVLAVVVSLVGLRLTQEGKWFLGWFGARGLASIVCAVLVIDADLPHGDTVTTVAAVTIILSLVLHGMTANPWASRWAK